MGIHVFLLVGMDSSQKGGCHDDGLIGTKQVAGGMGMLWTGKGVRGEKAKDG
jgi:hypothetical protein